MIKDIYIHIPFCKRKCPYCDFYSETSIYNFKEYVNTLIDEFNSYKNYLNRENSTLYFGGGTPSLLPTKEIERLFKHIGRSIDLTKSEITLELNPGEIDREKLLLYRDLGINRLSVGVQSFDDRELKTLGRIHSGAKAVETLEMIKKYGFENYNLDLIVGIPNQESRSLERNLKIVEELNPFHVSAYILTYYEGTRYRELLDLGHIKSMEEERELNFYQRVISSLKSIGIERYEISNYSKKGYESKHNSNVWNYGDYLGLGASAHSKLKNRRWSNISSTREYIKDFKSSKTIELISESDILNEKIMLSLRTVSGIKDKEITSSLYDHKLGDLERFKRDKLIDFDRERVFLTDRGFDLYNSIVSRLFI
ncbi:MAG: coproporphyrinogen III oxidase [Candidatus Cloacimonadota bacterium]|nr:MAG: coproporphyrinogen III oxidase [Candidatus Cloacimonadota bacterium]PIE79098.1 MAG: coproporphyrinogen III oxidase [Candidatus Delongbacteria bacterium]